MRLDGADVSASCFLSPFAVHCEPRVVIGAGRHRIDVVIGAFKKTWSFRAMPEPVVSEMSPESGSELELSALPVIRAKFCDANYKIAKRDVTLEFDEIDVTASATIEMNSAHCGRLEFAVPQPLTEGYHSANLVVVSASGLVGIHSSSFVVMPPAEYLVKLVSPTQDQVVKQAALPIRVSASSNRAWSRTVMMNNQSADLESPDAKPRIYRAEVHLDPGPNVVHIKTWFSDGEVRSLDLRVRYEPVASNGGHARQP